MVGSVAEFRMAKLLTNHSAFVIWRNVTAWNDSNFLMLLLDRLDIQAGELLIMGSMDLTTGMESILWPLHCLKQI